MDIFSESRYQEEFVEDEFGRLVEKTDDLKAEIRYLKYLLKAAGVDVPKTRKMPPNLPNPKLRSKTMTRKRYNEIASMARSLADGDFIAYYLNQHCGNACVTVNDQHVADAMGELLEVARVEETEE